MIKTLVLRIGDKWWWVTVVLSDLFYSERCALRTAKISRVDLENLASLVDALAWPVVAVAALLMFHRPLRGWLKERPQKAKLGPLEFEWASAVARTQVALEAESVLAPASSNTTLSNDGRKVAEPDSPAGSVIRESTTLEVTLRRSLQEAGVEDGSSSLAGLARQAANAGLIDARTATAVEGIATMRNLAAHSPERLTAEQASQFSFLVQSTASLIEAQARISRNMSPGRSNISPDDIATVVAENGPAEVVAIALKSTSPVKQRQTATALVGLGHIPAAMDIACEISNRGEARSVGVAVLDYIARVPPEQQQEGLRELERLRPRLKPAQLRDMRDHAQKVGVALPGEWMDEPTS